MIQSGNLWNTHVTHSITETRRLGKALAQELVHGTVVSLTGGLGSGKTCLVQGICSGLGVHQPVTSPTFTIINEYTGRLPVYHIDFYRINTIDEAYETGLEEYLYGHGICLIEWADKVESLLPQQRIDIHMEHDTKHRNWRTITIGHL